MINKFILKIYRNYFLRKIDRWSIILIKIPISHTHRPYEGIKSESYRSSRSWKEPDRSIDRSTDHREHALSKCLPFVERLKHQRRTRCVHATAAHKIIIMVAINRVNGRAPYFHSREIHISARIHAYTYARLSEGEFLPLFPRSRRRSEKGWRRTKDEGERTISARSRAL